jgi:ABC-type sugar transport system substrate-binding protein
MSMFTSTKNAAAVAAGLAAAKRAGGKVALPKEKIGIILIQGQAEIVQRMQQDAQGAANALGWKLLVCDGQGNHVTMQQCGDSLLNQGVNALIDTTIEPSVLHAQIQRAKSMGVPVINVAGVTDPDPYMINLSPASVETNMTIALDNWAFAQLKQKGPGPYTMSYTYAPGATALRVGQLLKDLKSHPNIKVVASHEINIANLTPDIIAFDDSTLTANPNLDLMWTAADVSLSLAGQDAISKLGKKSYPNRPLIVGFLDDLINIAAIRSGSVDALVTYPVTADCYIAMDQLAEYFARHQKINANASSDAQQVYGMTFQAPTVLTKANLPPVGEHVPPLNNYALFFATKWKAEFGV